jgi:hypothetical protein
MPLSTLAKNTKRVGSSLNSIKRVTPYTGNVVHGKILFKKIGKQQNNFINNNLKLIIRFVKNANVNNVNSDELLNGLATFFNGLSENIKNNIFKLLIDSTNISDEIKGFLKDNVDKFNITYTEGSLTINLEVKTFQNEVIFDGDKVPFEMALFMITGAATDHFSTAFRRVLQSNDFTVTHAKAADILQDIKAELSDINFYSEVTDEENFRKLDISIPRKEEHSSWSGVDEAGYNEAVAVVLKEYIQTIIDDIDAINVGSPDYSDIVTKVNNWNDIVGASLNTAMG